MRRILCSIAAVVMFGTPALADLASEFSSFNYVNEVGVSGLRSSYSTDVKSNKPVTGLVTSTALQSFGPDRVYYANVGTYPSPGGNEGKKYDIGALGWRLDGDRLVVKVASSIDPRAGLYSSSFNTWYSMGDVFLTVDDSAPGVKHFALLNSWARDAGGTPRNLNNPAFADAKAFHVAGGAGATSLEGHLVRFTSDGSVAITGGAGSYGPSNAPAGLDLRAFVDGGADLGDADLTHTTTIDGGKTWYLQTWTLDLSLLSNDLAFDAAFHYTVTCGNDSTGGEGTLVIPAPGAALLGVLGIAATRRLRRTVA